MKRTYKQPSTKILFLTPQATLLSGSTWPEGTTPVYNNDDELVNPEDALGKGGVMLWED